MSNDTIAGSGLEKMFYGQILSILVIIPLVGWIAAIVGIVLFLVGLHEAAGADEGYRTAFYVEIGILVLSVLAVFIGVLNIVTSILSLVVIYLVCTTTAGLSKATWARQPGDGLRGSSMGAARPWWWSALS